MGGGANPEGRSAGESPSSPSVPQSSAGERPAEGALRAEIDALRARLAHLEARVRRLTYGTVAALGFSLFVTGLLIGLGIAYALLASRGPLPQTQAPLPTSARGILTPKIIVHVITFTPTLAPLPTATPTPTPTPLVSVEASEPLYQGAWNRIPLNMGGIDGVLRVEGGRLALTLPQDSEERGGVELHVPADSAAVYLMPTATRVRLFVVAPDSNQAWQIWQADAEAFPSGVTLRLDGPGYLFDRDLLAQEEDLPSWVMQLPTTLTARVFITPSLNADIMLPVTITMTSTSPITPIMVPPVQVEPTTLLLSGGEWREVLVSLVGTTSMQPPAYEIVDLRVTTAGGEEARVPLVLVHGLKEGKFTLQLFEKRGDKQPVITRTRRGFPGWVAEREDDPWRLWLMEMVALDIRPQVGNIASCAKGEGEMRLGAQETKWCYVGVNLTSFQLKLEQLTLKCMAEPKENRCVVALWDKKEAHQNGF